MSMGRQHLNPARFLDLRRLAEQALEGKPRTGGRFHSGEAERLLHELQVYEIELQMQNEELRQFQESLLESQTNYQDLYDHAPVGYLTLNRVGMIQQANLKIAAMLGMDRDDLVGAPLSHFVFREDQDGLFLHQKRVLEKQEPQVSEIRLQNKDGHTIFVQLESMVHPNPGGAPAQWRTAISDISKLKRVEKDLRFSEAQFRSISESASEAIVASDSAGHILVWNQGAERIFGHTRDQILGQPLAILIPEKLRDAHTRAIRRVRKSGQSRLFGQTVELQGLRRNGETFPMDLSLSMWSIGDATFFSAIIRDLTARNELEEALRQATSNAESASRAKTLFLAHVSHEIRTPMNAILGMGEELAASDLDADQRHYVEVLNRSGVGLMALVNDILDLSKIEAGQMSLEVLDFDPRDLAQGTLEVLEDQARRKGIHLSCICDEGVPATVSGDPQRLRQILLNLLGNAVKFTDEGEVRLEMQVEEPESLLFAVTDTGIGIPQGSQMAIFHPFIQGETFTSRRFGGTGLGLAITRQLIDLMDGRIWVESCPGKGSRFFFSLPLPPADPIAPDAWTQVDKGRVDKEKDGAESPPNDLAMEPLSILLIDDSEDNRLLVKTFLKKTPFKLDEALDGSDGFEKYKKDRYDVVLMDIQMPVMDGYTATRKIREWEQGKQSPPAFIVALTAHALKEVEKQIMESGCDIYLSKPIRKSRLLAILAQAEKH